MNKPYEDYIAFIENQLGIQLLTYQKEFLQKMCDGNQYYFIPVLLGIRRTYLDGLKLLLETMTKGNQCESNSN